MYFYRQLLIILDYIIECVYTNACCITSHTIHAPRISRSKKSMIQLEMTDLLTYFIACSHTRNCLCLLSCKNFYNETQLPRFVTIYYQVIYIRSVLLFRNIFINRLNTVYYPYTYLVYTYMIFLLDLVESLKLLKLFYKRIHSNKKRNKYLIL